MIKREVDADGDVCLALNQYPLLLWPELKTMRIIASREQIQEGQPCKPDCPNSLSRQFESGD